MLGNWTNLQLLSFLLYLPLSDLLRLLRTCRRFFDTFRQAELWNKLWDCLLQRDYPTAWKFAGLEHYQVKYAWYKTIFQKKPVQFYITELHYLKQLYFQANEHRKSQNLKWEDFDSFDEEREWRLKIVQCLGILVASDEKKRLVDIISFKKYSGSSLQNWEPYLNWAYEIVISSKPNNNEIICYDVACEIKDDLSHFLIWIQQGIHRGERRCLELLRDSTLSFPEQERKNVYDLVLLHFPDQEELITIWFAKQLRKHGICGLRFLQLHSFVLSYDWFATIGLCFYDKQDYKEAKDCFEHGLSLAQSSPNKIHATAMIPWFLMNLIYVVAIKLNDYTKAMSWIQEVEKNKEWVPKKENPLFSNYYLALLHCFLALGQEQILDAKWKEWTAKFKECLPNDFQLMMLYRNQGYYPCLTLFYKIKGLFKQHPTLRMSKFIGTLGIRIVARSFARLFQFKEAKKTLQYYYVRVQSLQEPKCNHGHDGSFFLEKALIYWLHYSFNMQDLRPLQLSQLNFKTAKKYKLSVDAKPVLAFLQQRLYPQN